MNYKKILFVCFGVLLLGVVGWKIASPTKKVIESQPKFLVRVVIDDSKRIATYDGVLATTAFDALKIASAKSEPPFTLDVKQYSFGKFVQGIGGKENSKDKSWIYSVNGHDGTVAADKQKVTNGDTVLWQYTKPINE